MESEDVSSSDEEKTSYSRHELRERKALVQGIGEALKNRATGLVDALLDPLATIEGYITLLSTIPQLPELIDQYVDEFLYDLDDEERAEQLGKLLTEAVLLVVPSPSITNLSGITKRLGKAAGEVARISKKSFKTVSSKFLSKNGIRDIHKFKQDFLGKKVILKHFDVVRHTQSGELLIIRKSTQEVITHTGTFIK